MQFSIREGKKENPNGKLKPILTLRGTFLVLKPQGCRNFPPPAPEKAPKHIKSLRFRFLAALQFFYYYNRCDEITHLEPNRCLGNMIFNKLCAHPYYINLPWGQGEDKEIGCRFIFTKKCRMWLEVVT